MVEESGAPIVYGFLMLFFGGCGAGIGAILWVCGLPWHRILTCGGAGVLLGFALALVGMWMRGANDDDADNPR
jgi:hypothetical protein